MKYPDDDWHERQFGTPSLATEQDAVRDARVAELEEALRKIASEFEPGFGTLSGSMCARIARDALGMVEVERIPDGIKWSKGEVAFTRWPVGTENAEWHLIGPAVMLEPGTVVEVSRFSERDSAVVAVGRIVAERTVIHKIEGPVRYVVARVSRAVRD